MAAFAVWVTRSDRPEARRGPSWRRAGGPFFPFSVPPLSVCVVGSGATALGLAAYLASRGASVRLQAFNPAVRGAVRRLGGVLVEVVDDVPRVVPVKLASVRGYRPKAELLVLAGEPEIEGAGYGLAGYVALALPGSDAWVPLVDAAAVVWCETAPVDVRLTATAAVRFTRVRPWVATVCEPRSRERAVFGRLKTFLPMLVPARPVAPAWSEGCPAW